MFSARRRIKDGGGREIPSFFFCFSRVLHYICRGESIFTNKLLIMRKELLGFVILLAGLLAAVPAEAQMRFGVKGGLNISNVEFDMSVADMDNRKGFFVGPMVEFTVPIVGIGMDVAVLYDQREMKLGEMKDKTQYIDVPINVKYSIGTRMIGVFVTAGPQFAFNVGGKNIFDEVRNGHTFELSNSVLSMNVGGGVKLFGRLQVGYNYNIDLGNTGEMKLDVAVDKVKNNDFKYKTHQISVAYLF